MNVLRDLCHWCDGSGKDEDAVRAASYPDWCPHCGGTGLEPEHSHDTTEICWNCEGERVLKHPQTGLFETCVICHGEGVVES